MTDDPFDDLERPSWLAEKEIDPRFHAALRLDGLLNSWDSARSGLEEMGICVDMGLGEKSCAEVRRFLGEWIERTGALYMAVSLPPTFAFPEDSPRGKLIAECVLPVAGETGCPFALMIGSRRAYKP